MDLPSSRSGYTNNSALKATLQLSGGTIGRPKDQVSHRSDGLRWLPEFKERGQGRLRETWGFLCDSTLNR